ncbi:hypothetical protein RCO28_26575 [Streptomyces sp. LHD-70]|uniref:hypothetical protein n=1 Tax=Streptomyces sp. LHD-70 TaxID=3072140 RepID=UPI00280E70F3|nr:hypothetical protein [Streptomyces sp. LHD-70]MDQ8706016.1 hypothetical protein [Streptomyces sp. LHD-70]
MSATVARAGGARTGAGTQRSGEYMTRLTALDHLLGDGRHHLSRLTHSVHRHEILEPLAGAA